MANSKFADDGCHLHDVCLTCPFPLCYYDDPTHPAFIDRKSFEARRVVVMECLRGGKIPIDIAEELGISVRTVQRIKAEAK